MKTPACGLQALPADSGTGGAERSWQRCCHGQAAGVTAESREIAGSADSVPNALTDSIPVETGPASLKFPGAATCSTPPNFYPKSRKVCHKRSGQLFDTFTGWWSTTDVGDHHQACGPRENLENKKSLKPRQATPRWFNHRIILDAGVYE